MAKRETFVNGQVIGDCTYINEEAPLNDNGVLRRIAKFKCVCGKEFIDRIDKIKSLNSKGCGCRKGGLIHGHTVGYKHSLEYKSWYKMKDRCYNINDKGYCRYGKRGIVVCESWLTSFENFLSDMGVKPTQEHSIERKDNNGNYEPSNCKWATRTEQARNRISNVFITYKGETHCINEWADILKIKKSILNQRLKRYKWPIEQAFNKKVKQWQS